MTDDAAATADSEARILAESIIDTIREPLLVLHADLRVKSASASFYRFFQVNPAETEGCLVYELGNGQWNIPELHRLLSDILPKSKVLDDFEVTHAFEAIGPRTLLLNARQIDHVQLILLAIEDITERKRVGERERILISELRHRVKNMLTIVQSLFVQTTLYSPSVERLRDTFLGRLHALARTHDHLMRREWRGMDLRELVEHELAPYRRALLPDLNGPRVRLGERESTALTMTLHELATNAAKYGALSVPEGRVSVRWETTDGEGGRWVHLRWRERDGPPVRTPANRGFGTSLIERNITYELNGEVGLNFAAAGLECDLRFPLDG